MAADGKNGPAPVDLAVEPADPAPVEPAPVDLAVEPADPAPVEAAAAELGIVAELRNLLDLAYAFYNQRLLDMPRILASYRALVAAIHLEFGRQPGDGARNAARKDARAARIVHAVSIPLCLRGSFYADSEYVHAAFPAVIPGPDRATADLCLMWGVGRKYAYVRSHGAAAAGFVLRLCQVAKAFPEQGDGVFGWPSPGVRIALDLFAGAGDRMTLAELTAATEIALGEIPPTDWPPNAPGRSASESAMLVFAFAPGKVVRRDANAVAGTYAYGNPRGAALLRLAEQGDGRLALSAALMLALSESSDRPSDDLAPAIIAALRRV